MNINTVSHLYRLAIAAFVAGFFIVGTTANAQVQVPIEVIGPDGYTKSVTVNVPSASEVSRLWLQVHSPGYKYGAGGKMSVRINGGSWTDVNNQIAICEALEDNYDCIGGAFATVRFTLPASGVVTGNNTIDFRFNGTDGLTIGYRVLGVNFVRSNNSKILPESTFAYDDPKSWTAPLPGSSDISQGKVLWETADLIDFGNVSITATCADCHAKSGRDLQYFGYSNHSIIERSKFHGLSQTEGEQIASYIRDLAVVSHGTPWDPPYQPGPGLDSRPADEWAAGAGLDWVLEDDEQMIAYMFPNGSTDDVLTENDLNMREIPIGIQLPDWNEWLPRVHPKDAWGSTFTNSSVYSMYLNDIPNTLSNGSQSAINNGSILSTMDSWGSAIRSGRGDGSFNNEHFGGWGSDGTVPDYMLGYQQWQAVKTWEIMTTYELQEAAPTLYPGNGEVRSWFGNTRSVFDVAPHISGPAQGGMYPHGNALQNYYMSSAWYELQLILNSGNRNGVSIRPHDWKYHYGHIGDIAKESGRREPMRHLKSYVKNMQMADNRFGVGTANGFYLRHVSPNRMIVASGAKNPFTDMDTATRRSVTEPILRSLVKKLMRHDISEWSRQTGLYGIEPASTSPSAGNGFDTSTYIDHFYHAIPVFNSLGVAPSLLDSLANWTEQAWPLGDWHSLFDFNQSNNPPTVTLTSPSNGATFTEPATISMAATASDIDGSISSVTFYQNGDQLQTDNSAPYSFTWSGVAPGTYIITAQATDNDGESTTTAGVSVTVNEDDGNPPVNQPPSVTITSPASSNEFSVGADVSIQATASDTDGSIANVEFFQNGSSISVDSSSPYTAVYSNAQEGSYELTAVATDNNGATTTSSTVSITVGDAPSNQSPSVSITNPIAGTEYEVGADASLQATASDSDGSVSSVEFFQNGSSLGVDNSSPYAAVFSNMQEGSYLLTATATDNNGAKTTSSSVTISVGDNPPPPPQTQSINLIVGWNQVSTFIAPQDAAIASILQPIESDVFLVKDVVGNTYHPALGINTIDTWSSLESYQVYANNASTFQVTGSPLDPAATSVPVAEGWNFVPYLRTTAMSISEALANASTGIVMVKDYAGRVFFPDFQIDEIGVMEPGQGYKLFVNGNGAFTYPANSAQTVQAQDKSSAVLTGLASSALYVIDATQLPGARKVVAKLENGTIVGEAWISSTAAQAFLKVTGDDEVTQDIVEGAVEGDRIILEAEFGIGDLKRVAASEITDVLSSQSREVLYLSYQTDSAFLVELGEIPDEYTLDQNYPNPFNPSTTIKYELPSDQFVKLEVFNMLGERVATLVSGDVSAGSHTVTFEADDLASGLYVYRLRAGSNVQDRAMMLMK